MTAPCLVCLRPAAAGDRYHPACLSALFGHPAIPDIDIDDTTLRAVALDMLGDVSLPGVQRKLAMAATGDGDQLRLTVGPGRFILKPAGTQFPALPENEHVTMRIAAAAGIRIPPCGLFELRDGSPAYVVARFDRPAGGGKLAAEDFCQLTGHPPRDKYHGSAERCARVVRRHATDPAVAVVELYRRFVFAWIVGNGDMHLKNLSMLSGPNGHRGLSPAYDLVSTRLFLHDDRLALPVRGRYDELTVDHWRDFAHYCKLAPGVAARELAALATIADPAIELIDASRLPDDMKHAYRELVRERAATLARG